ncbi:MAG: hypothetical protein NWE96_05980 [Candidatus Bathyarchaeota archaeon]|nr:hypothetical protein [Candidatus Bathyarchaeota archaeon]
MSESNRQLLTLGIFLLTIVVAIGLYAVGLIEWTLIAPVVLLLSGLWMLALAAIRMGNPIRYERSGFSTMALGLIAIAVGGAWFLWGINWLYSIILVLLVAAALSLAAALKRK